MDVSINRCEGQLSLLRRFCADENGSTAIEYCIMAMMISVACIGAIRGLGNGITSTWSDVANKVAAATK